MGKFREWLAFRLLERAKPYRHLYHADERPYMMRYWLLKLGRGQVIDGEVMPRWLGIRLHVIRSSDDDRAYHDHPWWFVSWILVGRYVEHRPGRMKTHYGYPLDVPRLCKPGSIRLRFARSWHRLELAEGETAITVFMHGPRRQGWGFRVGDKKVPWREFAGTGVQAQPRSTEASS